MTGSRPLPCVVDASVGIKLFVVEPLSPEAHALFGQLAADPPSRLYVPDLFYIECANVLWKYTQRLGLAAEDARDYIAQLGLLALRTVSTAELLADTLDIALAHRITAYDAAYVALAGQLGLPLITADERLVRALSGSSFSVQWLGDLSPGLPPPPEPA